MQLPPPITSRTNARVKALRAAFSGKAAKPGELVGLEGEHLVVEALRSGLLLDTIFVRQGSEAVLERESLAGLDRDRVVVLSADVFASGVDTASPQGIAVTLTIPELRLSLKDGSPLLILEAVRDPGNLGTLLRSAEAFGVPFVLTMGDVANPWNPKVVRASAGSVFRIPVLRIDPNDVRDFLSGIGTWQIYAAVVGDGAHSILDVQFDDRTAILIGNEGAGLSSQAIALADALVRIPCAVESLNAAVAGSTILYEVMRQRKATGQ
jgi:TrmH family RNA methyltransferase